MHLYLAGISLGLGLLSKYTMVFYAAGLLSGLIAGALYNRFHAIRLPASLMRRPMATAASR